MTEQNALPSARLKDQPASERPREKLAAGGPDPTPSEADIKVTRDLVRAGQVLKISVVDHLIFGQATTQRAQDWVSLRELGYLYD